MISAFLALSLAPPIAPGAYALPELFRQLSTATGVPHVMDVNVRDYPVFVSVKSGDPARVEKLVAAALHAEWRDDAGKMRLAMTKPVPNEDLDEFQKAYLKACGSEKAYAALPILDVYRMAPGEVVRYNWAGSALIRKFPPKFPADSNSKGLTVRRMAYGNFEFTGMRSITLNSISDSVEKFLGDELGKTAVDGKEKEAMRQRMMDPEKAKFDLVNLDKQDPVAAISEPILGSVAKKISKDLVVALPDFSMFATMLFSNGSGTVQSILQGYNVAVNWTVVDDAVVGRLPNIELTSPSQARRPVVAKFVQGVGAQSAANVAVLSDYVKSQRVGSSNSWTDAMMLVMGGIVLDEEFIGDYPFNIRLYTQFSNPDWGLLRSGQPFTVAQLSLPAQKLVRDLLLQSRSCIQPGRPDPAFWPTLDPADLLITAQVNEEPILIGFTGIAPMVQNVESSAMNYEMRKKELGREPLYQPGTRRKLDIEIMLAQDATQSIRTGFSEVTPNAKIKPAMWTQLPADMLKRFRESLEQYRKFQERDLGGTPPPLSR